MNDIDLLVVLDEEIEFLESRLVRAIGKSRRRAEKIGEPSVTCDRVVDWYVHRLNRLKGARGHFAALLQAHAEGIAA